MLTLPDSWVWDFWLAPEGPDYHLFFLFASKALHDPDARHFRASIGHAVSRDLREWTRLPDALVRSDPGAFDDLATWTGCVVKDPAGPWRMFYTGVTMTPVGDIQRIGVATSQDLVTWHKSPDNPLIEADPRWYEKLGDSSWDNEAFRDPIVFRDPQGDGWHMLMTARGRQGAVDDRGVVGHAWSPDLVNWQVREPLSLPGEGFAQLEVMEIVEIGGRLFLLFNCLSTEIAGSDPRKASPGGVWLAPAASHTGPFDLAGALKLCDEEFYVARIVDDPVSGGPAWMAFGNRLGEAGALCISDPMAIPARLLEPPPVDQTA